MYPYTKEGRAAAAAARGSGDDDGLATGKVSKGEKVGGGGRRSGEIAGQSPLRFALPAVACVSCV